MKAVLGLMAAALVLSACGGGKSRVERFYGGASVVQVANGPMQRACERSERTQASPTLCGCIQNVADQELSGSDQRLAVRFFKDPHHAQEIRQSDRSSHEAFWTRYKTFVGRAERQCSGV